MTLEEKIGQMIQSDQELIKDPGDIGKYFLGSVLSGGNSDPSAGNSLTAWADLYDRCQRQALKTRLGIPILYGIDAVHGNNNVLGAVIFPHNIALGCTRNPELVEKVARVTAEEVRASGMQWTFAPCVTVPRDERWGRTYEGFSEDPNLVSILGEAADPRLSRIGAERPAFRAGLRQTLCRRRRHHRRLCAAGEAFGLTRATRRSMNRPCGDYSSRHISAP